MIIFSWLFCFKSKMIDVWHGNTLKCHLQRWASNRKVGSRSFRDAQFHPSQSLTFSSLLWAQHGSILTGMPLQQQFPLLSLWIKQDPSKLSNLMVLDNNIITTYSGRKGLLYLQRGGNLKRLCVHLDSSDSTKWNCLASLWNPCILNVHKIINLDTNVSYTYKLRFNLLLNSLALKKIRAAKIRPTKFRRWEELGFKYFLLILYFHLYAELPLIWKVVLCVHQKGTFLPS